MEYPCIVYELDDIVLEHADNSPYRQTRRYQVTVIDRDPDTTIPDEIMKFPMSEFDRKYDTQGLNHFVHTIYF